MRVVAYTRVSTAEQAESGAGLAAQRSAIVAEVERRGWQLLGVFEDAGASGKALTGRLGLIEALASIEAGDADGLVVAKLDRLSRSLLDFAALMARSRANGWMLVCLDVGVDTSTPSGEMVANVLAVFAEFERRLIGQRTRDALATRRAAGVRLGRPQLIPPAVREQMRDARARGVTLRAIADQLNADGVPTAQGGRLWHPETVRRAIKVTAVSTRPTKRGH